MLWFLWLLSVVCLQALTIQTIQDLPLKQKSGAFSGAVVYKNTAQQQLIVQGVYQLKGNKLTLQALRLKKLPPKSKKSIPTAKPTTTPLKDLRATQDLGAILPDKIHKHTRIYFKDPNPAKMAQILGLTYKDYLRFAPPQSTTFMSPTSPTSWQSTHLQNLGTPTQEKEESQNSKERESKTNLEKRTNTPKTYTAKGRTPSKRSSYTSTRRTSARRTSSRAKTTSARSAKSPTSKASFTATSTTRARSVRRSASAKRTTSPSPRSASASTRNTRRDTTTQTYNQQTQNDSPPQNYSPSFAQNYSPPSQSYSPSPSPPSYNPSYMPLPLNYPQANTPSTPSQTPSTPTTQPTQPTLKPPPTPSALLSSPKETPKPLETQEKETPKPTESEEKQPGPADQTQDEKAKQPAQEKPEPEAKKLEPNPKATLEVQTHLGMGGAQEEACGVYSYDDAKLQAKRPSVMRALDKASGQLLDIGPCDFQADSASGKGAGITLAYTELPPKVEILGPTTTMHTFILSKANYSEKLCYKAKTRQCLHIEPNTTTEWSSTYSTTTTRTIRTYQRPPPKWDKPPPRSLAPPQMRSKPREKPTSRRTTCI